MRKTAKSFLAILAKMRIKFNKVTGGGRIHVNFYFTQVYSLSHNELIGYEMEGKSERGCDGE
jgi:hypothetical protein